MPIYLRDLRGLDFLSGTFARLKAFTPASSITGGAGSFRRAKKVWWISGGKVLCFDEFGPLEVRPIAGAN